MSDLDFYPDVEDALPDMSPEWWEMDEPSRRWRDDERPVDLGGDEYDYEGLP